MTRPPGRTLGIDECANSGSGNAVCAGTVISKCVHSFCNHPAALAGPGSSDCRLSICRWGWETYLPEAQGKGSVQITAFRCLRRSNLTARPSQVPVPLGRTWCHGYTQLDPLTPRKEIVGERLYSLSRDSPPDRRRPRPPSSSVGQLVFGRGAQRVQHPFKKAWANFPLSPTMKAARGGRTRGGSVPRFSVSP
jgi:hypothetical protein